MFYDGSHRFNIWTKVYKSNILLFFSDEFSKLWKDLRNIYISNKSNSKEVGNDENTGVPAVLNFVGLVEIQRNEDGDRRDDKDNLRLFILLFSQKKGKFGNLLPVVRKLMILLNRSENRDKDNKLKTAWNQLSSGDIFVHLFDFKILYIVIALFLILSDYMNVWIELRFHSKI